MTLRQRIKFTTIENLKECKSTTIMSGLKVVIILYNSQKFNIGTMFMDNKFEVLYSDLKQEHFTLNTTTEDEHVPDIEKQVRFIKERLRAIKIPFHMIAYPPA